MSGQFRLFLGLFIVGTCHGGTRMVYSAEGLTAPEQRVLAYILNIDQQTDAPATHFDIEQSGGPKSVHFSRWVDEFFGIFAYNTRVKKNYAEFIFNRVLGTVIKKLKDGSIVYMLVKGYDNQCGLSERVDKEAGRMFLKKISGINGCLDSVHNDLKELNSNTNNKIEDLNVRDYVMNRLTCGLLPRALHCYLSVLEQIVGCMGNGGAVSAAVTAITDLVTHYCGPEMLVTVSESLQNLPHNCVTEGLPTTLKYLEPSFIGELTAVSDYQFPCVYSKYLISVVEVILVKYCRAKRLFHKMSEIEAEFQNYAGCAKFDNRPTMTQVTKIWNE